VIDSLADQRRTFGHLALFRANHSQQNQAPGLASAKVLAVEVGEGLFRGMRCCLQIPHL
jgi:hypothetical protein